MFPPRYRYTITALSLATLAALGAPPAATAAAADSPVAGRVNFRADLKSIDGFGVAEAFQRADVLHGARGLSPQHQQEVLDLLLSRDRGVGISILRLGIGSSADNVYDHMHSIQPTNPGSPTAPPQYVWDGDDGGQVWLAQQAKAYGVRQFYADAWSAPGYMKDSGSDINGGTLCGLPGTSCASGDWRQAYANYLVQYARFYAAEGIHITHLGFTNEPDLATSYASMQLTPAQATDMAKVLGPTVKRSGLRASVVCCDVAGWSEQAPYSAAIEADPAADRWVKTHTGHPYVSPVTSALPTDRPVWMSEWNPPGNVWNEAWDSGQDSDGIALVEHIHNALTTGDASAYVFWFGASIGATRALIQLDGDAYHVSKRLWALAAYSRFIRPAAVRVAASAVDPAVKVTAYRNADGSRVLEILNTATTASQSSFVVDGATGRATTYLTDNDHALSLTDAATLRGRQLAVNLAPRSLTTVVLGQHGLQ
jgi:glucuronoarabinoxylan endo-1,4-beta-xylanase